MAEARGRLPLVQLDRSADGVDLDWVGLDDDHAMRSVVRHLAERGARDVALVTSSARNSSGRLRTAAAMTACPGFGLQLTLDRVFDGEFSTGWGAEAARRILAQPTLPDAVICTDDQIAIGVMQELQDHGVRVPDDVKITGLDDVPHASLMHPGLTTVRQPVADIAAEAVQLLMLELSGGDRAARRVSLRGELVARGSTSS